jgi:hypothetical protein
VSTYRVVLTGTDDIDAAAATRLRDKWRRRADSKSAGLWPSLGLRRGGWSFTGEDRLLQNAVDAPIAVDDLGDAEIDRD